jgi:hypothetical protein
MAASPERLSAMKSVNKALLREGNQLIEGNDK